MTLSDKHINHRNSKTNDIRTRFTFPFQAPMIARVEAMLWDIVPRFQFSEALVEDIYNLFQETKEHGLASGRSHKIMFATSLFVSLIGHGAPIRLDEFTTAVGMKASQIRVGLKPLAAHGYKILPDYEAFLERYTAQLSMDEALLQIKSIFRATRRLFTGKSPHGHIGGIIYYVGTLLENGPTQKRISSVTGMSVVAVRKSYQRIRKFYAPR
jgi:transcription initiation factor TFIIIB Brf1 subunit/transcription initiation factor TFIIB